MVLMDPLEESLLRPLSVTWLSPRSGGCPAPGLRGSLTRLFPRYVQEVIQRGRSCVRPACTPMLSVVPAVSDMELSETEYVRPRGPSRTAHPALAVGQASRSSCCSEGGSLGIAREELGLPAAHRPFLPVSPSTGTLTVHVVTNDQQAREAVCSASSTLTTRPAFFHFPEPSSRALGHHRVGAAAVIPLTRCRLEASAPMVRVCPVLCVQQAWLCAHVGRICSRACVEQRGRLGTDRPHADNGGHLLIPALLLETEQKGVPHLSPHQAHLRRQPAQSFATQSLPPFCREQAHSGPPSWTPGTSGV